MKYGRRLSPLVWIPRANFFNIAFLHVYHTHVCNSGAMHYYQLLPYHFMARIKVHV